MLAGQKYHYFYKITNTINNHFYYGIHSTNDLNDGYMGSGSRLKIAIKKYGIENFSKEIIKFFNNREELDKYEAEIVTESLVRDPNCYNMVIGGDCLITSGTTTVIDDKGNTFRVPVDDPMMYIEYKPIASDRVYCLDTVDNQYKIIDINGDMWNSFEISTTLFLSNSLSNHFFCNIIFHPLVNSLPFILSRI